MGGLSGILVSGLAILVQLWNYNSFENAMASHLFKFRHKQSNFPQGSSFKLRSMPNCLDILELCLPRRCFCIKRSPQDKAIEKARDYLDKEVNIYKIIRMRRYMMEALKILITKPKRKELIKRTRYRTIDIDPRATGISKSIEDSFFESSKESTSEGEESRMSNIRTTRRSSRKHQEPEVYAT